MNLSQIPYLKVLWCCLLIFSVLLPHLAKAHYFSPMGVHIDRAELIVIGTMVRQDPTFKHTVIGNSSRSEGTFTYAVSVSKVLKGSEEYLGKTFVIGGRITSSTARVKLKQSGVAILFYKDWQAYPKRWPITASYYKAEKIEQLKHLIKPTNLSEKDHLKTLQNLALNEKSITQPELLHAFSEMKNPDNFDLLLGLHDKLDAKEYYRYVDIIARTYDLRAVPTLIKLLSSSHKRTRSKAAHTLRYNFPGAKDVIEAFKKHLTTADVIYDASIYLAERGVIPEKEKSPESRLSKAKRLYLEGKDQQAQILLSQLLADKSIKNNQREWVSKFFYQVDLPIQTSHRKRLLPLFHKYMASHEKLVARDVNEGLRKLKYNDALSALLLFFDSDELKDEETLQQVTMAIRDLGEDARRQAVTRLEKILISPNEAQQRSEYCISLLLSFAWLADEVELADMKLAEQRKCIRYSDEINPLIELDTAEDEVVFLLGLLVESTYTLDPKSIFKGYVYEQIVDWLIFRLGDLKDKRAIKPLATYLNKIGAYPREIEPALINIGGLDVESAMTKLLAHKHYSVRRVATKVLRALQGERFFLVAREIIKRDDFGDKYQAYYFFTEQGNWTEFELLVPYCDFWNEQYRQYTSVACSAMNAIRKRYNHDLSGSYVKETYNMKLLDRK